MVKQQISFVCQECGYESPKFLGKCPECGTWNSLKEFHEAKISSKQSRSGSVLPSTQVTPQTLQEITFHESDRLKTGFDELNTVLGGGIVPGSVILLAGDPGIGKSTLLLQLALNVAGNGPSHSSETFADQAHSVKFANQTKEKNSKSSEQANFKAPQNEKTIPVGRSKVLYISGEESVQQIKLRATRIENALENKNLLLASLTNTDTAIALIQKENPALVIVDSIQTMESDALDSLSGSVGQVRYGAIQYINAAKTLNVPIILVGHVTKEGMVAGPMVLSHMVDTVLFLEGERFTQTRLLRSLKNRFGPVDEVGVFSMDESGMSEVKNPGQLFLSNKQEDAPGSVLSVIMEGTRPFIVEIQALVVRSKLPIPRRVAVGVDHRKLEILLAVLQKQCKISFDTTDVFVNVAGGIKVTDPGTDLGICLAILSSLKNKNLRNTIAIAEVGLLGQLRAVTALEKRIKEAKKLGFNQVITGKNYTLITSVVQDLDFGTNQEPSWQQENERTYRVRK